MVDTDARDEFRQIIQEMRDSLPKRGDKSRPEPDYGCSEEMDYGPSAGEFDDSPEEVVSDLIARARIRPFLPKGKKKKRPYKGAHLVFPNESQFDKTSRAIERGKPTFVRKSKLIYEKVRHMVPKAKPPASWCRAHRIPRYLFSTKVSVLNASGPRVANLLLFLRMKYILEVLRPDSPAPAVPRDYFLGTNKSLRFARRVLEMSQTLLTHLCPSYP